MPRKVQASYTADESLATAMVGRNLIHAVRNVIKIFKIIERKFPETTTDGSASGPSPLTTCNSTAALVGPVSASAAIAKVAHQQASDCASSCPLWLRHSFRLTVERAERTFLHLNELIAHEKDKSGRPRQKANPMITPSWKKNILITREYSEPIKRIFQSRSRICLCGRPQKYS